MMKVVGTFFFFLATSSCSNAASSSLVASSNPQECLDSSATAIDPDMDYFPDKVFPKFSKYWSVTYHNTYKILKSSDGNATYVLYQCGTEPPTDVPDVNATIPVPLQHGVALTTTTSLPHFELLGLRDEIKAYLGDPQWITSPCFLDQIESGETINVLHPEDEGAIEGLLAQTSSEIVIYGDLIGGILDAPNFVAIAAWKERDNHGIGTLFACLCVRGRALL
jgi:hypothetical protein